MTRRSSLTRRLWTQPDLERARAERCGDDWESQAVIAFEQSITEAGFPCFFAPIAHRKQTLYFGFLDDASDPAGAEIVSQYLDRLDALHARDAAYHVLMIAVRPDGGTTTGESHLQAQAFLDALIAHDPSPWPPGATRDESDPTWQLFVRGVPMFVNVNVPSYARRRSRNLGPCLMFVIQPRKAFDVIAGRDAAGVRLREEIRTRIDRFDAIPRSPCLGFYTDDGSHEASQFILGDDNARPIRVTCPRHTGENRPASDDVADDRGRSRLTGALRKRP